MKISLLLLTCLLHGINCMEKSSSVMKYLEDRAKIVGEKLIRHARKAENVYNVKLNNTNNMKLIGNYSSGEIFTLYNTPYALMDGELYKISQNNHSVVHTFLPKENFTFVKTIEFRNLAFLLLGSKSDILHIFGFGNKSEKFFKIQNIVHANTTDAAFFESQNELYLLISSYKSHDFTSIVLYKFVHSHFDEIEHFSTSGAAKLHTFHNNGSEIIVLLHKFGVSSAVYEFKDDRIKKIQKIDTKEPEQVVNYLYMGKRYVVFFSGTNQVSLYFWTDSELLLWEEFTTEVALTGKKSVFYINNNPYLFIASNTSFLIFSLINHQFRLIYSSKFRTDIWSYDFIAQKNVLVALGPTVNNSLEISTVSISVQMELLDENLIEEEKLSSCFLDLEKAVYVLRNKLSEAKNNSDNLLREADNDNDKTPGAFSARKMADLFVKYSVIKFAVQNYQLGNLVIDETTVLDIPTGTKKVIAKDLRFNKLNDQKWHPEQWLSYTLPQTIAGTLKAQFVQVDNLKASHEPLFNDVMLSKGNQIMSGSISVNNLETDQMNTKFLNDIPVQNFYFKSQPMSIQGKKSFPELTAKNVNTAGISGTDGTKVMRSAAIPNLLKYNFDVNLTVENLWVDNINGINFDEFKNSVFRIGVVDTITGNLTFTNLHATEMIFDTLSNKSSVLTTSTDQNINSAINISKIFTKSIKTNRINGIDFGNSVATLDDNVISGPVSIRHLKVENNLELKGDVEQEFLVLNDTHIVGTNESDFLQRYNRKVTIKGNLILKNFDLGKNAKLFVSDAEFNPKMNQFWTKTTQQEIPTHFEAQNGISTPHLFTNFVNGVSVRDYLLNSTQQNKAAKFYFDNVTIKGNVLLNPNEEHSPDLERIQQDSVKINGTFNIKGHKIYTNILKVDRLEINDFGGGNAENAPSSGPRKIHNLTIKGNLHSKKLLIEQINNVKLQELVENSIYIDQPQNVAELNFENVTARNVFITSSVNGNNMNELILKLNQIDNIDRIDNVYVSDNVTIQNVENLLSINDQDINQLMLSSVSQYHNNTLYGNITFRGNVKVKDLYILTVNDVNLREISERILYKSWNQPIRAHFTFTKLISNNLVTDQINNFHVKDLIDILSIEPQKILVPNGLRMEEQIKVQNLFGQFDCDIEESLRNLRHPPSQFWDNVVITGNVKFWDKQSVISHIFDEVVSLERSNQVIRGEVTFVNHIAANNITSLGTINGIDMMEIIEDAVLNRPDIEQVVTGKKTFTQLEAETLENLQNTNVSTINDINILEINEKIVSRNSILDVPIKGKKVFFGGLQTIQIETEFISGIEAQNLVSFENTSKVPSAMFESVDVSDNLNIGFINGMPFEVFLKERLLKESPKQIVTGNYFFHDVTFTENISTPEINDIRIENVIFDKNAQVIESSKIFKNDLKIVGNMQSELINGLKLAESYERAVLQNEETNFTGIVQILKPALIEGNIQTKYINNVPIDYMLDTNAKHSIQLEEAKIHAITLIISNFVNKYLNTTIRMPTELLYLEKSVDLQIPLPNTISAHIVETKDDILIHVESEEDGNTCGLPQNCKCPMQQTMQISSEHSVNMFMNKETQRIYTHYDDDIMINVITHSISSSSDCRASKAKLINEVSSMTWSVPPGKNITGGFFVHRAFFSGFISGVEFFTIYGRTYVVIGIYYDPASDSHNVNSLVLRFNEDKTAIEEIQKIPTVGIRTLSLIPTAQGMVLVLGNHMSDQFNSTNTQILRFSEQKQQFELLREVPVFGSLFAEGVVLETDSLIILANQRSTLHVLKYEADFDNYYFYQSFQLDYPVSSISVFYAEGFGISDAYLSVVTTDNKYFIYSFMFIEGWKLEFSGELDGVKILVPFKLNKKSYLFAPSSKASSLLTLVEHDSD